MTTPVKAYRDACDRCAEEIIRALDDAEASHVKLGAELVHRFRQNTDHDALRQGVDLFIAHAAPLRRERLRESANALYHTRAAYLASSRNPDTREFPK